MSKFEGVRISKCAKPRKTEMEEFLLKVLLMPFKYGFLTHYKTLTNNVVKWYCRI